MVKLIKEGDYSETDEFTLVKEMNHWIKSLKRDYVDDSEFQKKLADYFYYDEGAHDEDFKELRSVVKQLQKIWNKLDIIEEKIDRK